MFMLQTPLVKYMHLMYRRYSTTDGVAYRGRDAYAAVRPAPDFRSRPSARPAMAGVDAHQPGRVSGPHREGSAVDVAVPFRRARRRHRNSGTDRVRVRAHVVRAVGHAG